MNYLIDVRSNVLYKKDENGDYIKFNEIILLVDKPKYKFTNEREITRERDIEEFRFMVIDSNIEGLIEALKSILKEE